MQGTCNVEFSPHRRGREGAGCDAKEGSDVLLHQADEDLSVLEPVCPDVLEVVVKVGDGLVSVASTDRSEGRGWERSVGERELGQTRGGRRP